MLDQVKKENFMRIKLKTLFKQALLCTLPITDNKCIGGWSMLPSKNVYKASKLPANTVEMEAK